MFSFASTMTRAPLSLRERLGQMRNLGLPSFCLPVTGEVLTLAGGCLPRPFTDLFVW